MENGRNESKEETMTFSKHVILVPAVITGLMFLIGTGCGDKDKSQKVIAELTKEKYEKSRMTTQCLVAIPTNLGEADEAKRRAECLAVNI
jgi:hypothetical protein